MDNDPETLLRRLRDRDAEIGVLLQRVHLLNCRRAPPSDHGFGQHGGMGSYDALKERLSVVYGCREKVGVAINVDEPAGMQRTDKVAILNDHVYLQQHVSPRGCPLH